MTIIFREVASIRTGSKTKILFIVGRGGVMEVTNLMYHFLHFFPLINRYNIITCVNS